MSKTEVGSSTKKADKKNSGIKSFAIFFAAGMLLLMAAVFAAGFCRADAVNIKITATGESSKSSLGNNVRFNRIILDEGTDREREYNLSLIPLSAPWQYDEENRLVYAYNLGSPAELELNITDADSVTINFISEVGSGIIEVSAEGGKAERLDLYSASNWSDVTRTYKRGFAWVYMVYVLVLLLAAAGVLCIVKKGYYDNRDEIHSYIKRINVKMVLAAALVGAAFALSYIVLIISVQRPIYRNLYRDDVVLTIEAAAKKSGSSLAKNVRVSQILVNDVAYDFSKADTRGGWKYNSIHNLLTCENPEHPDAITIPLENVRTIDIKFVGEVGSGIANVYIDGRKTAAVDLYKNAEWEYKYYKYEVSPLIRPYRAYPLLGLLFLTGFGLCLALYDNKRLVRVFVFLGANYIMALFICLLCSFVQSGSPVEAVKWAFERPNNFWFEVTLTALFCMILSFISGRSYISGWITAFGVLFLLTVNYYKLQFRNTPLLPWDFALASEAASVVAGFELKIYPVIVAAIIAAVIAAVLLTRTERRFFTKKFRLWLRLPAAVISAGLLCFFVSCYYIDFNRTINMFSVKELYENEGFINAFVKCTRYLLPMEEPEGYSEETMSALAQEIYAAADGAQGSEKPNIILIMSESFWDIERIDKLKINEEMFPTYRKLQSESLTGELLTNVFGGGTVNSEFEAITGFSVGYLPKEYMPYQRCMRKDMFSINSYLKSIGYDSTAIHPFEATNYNRNVAYDYFGFDKKIWEADFDENCDRMRGYVSDKALVEKIIAEYEEHNSTSDAPWFNLSVTMQNHGGYWGSSIDEGKELDIDLSEYEESSQDSIRDLAIGLHYADLALGELIDYFENQSEPTVIIMFGDHMSDAGPIGITLLGQSDMPESDSSDENVYARHRVPFMAWSNYKQVDRQYGTLSVTQLMPTVMTEYDVQRPDYFSYLYSTQSVFGACASGLFVDADGNVQRVDKMTEEQKALYDKLWLIEYDYIYGENYLKNIFGN